MILSESIALIMMDKCFFMSPKMVSPSEKEGTIFLKLLLLLHLQPMQKHRDRKKRLIWHVPFLENASNMLQEKSN
ncbi:hypothetical protein D3C72_1502140 [compost metagenome]